MAISSLAAGMEDVSQHTPAVTVSSGQLSRGNGGRFPARGPILCALAPA